MRILFAGDLMKEFLINSSTQQLQVQGSRFSGKKQQPAEILQAAALERVKYHSKDRTHADEAAA